MRAIDAQLIALFREALVRCPGDEGGDKDPVIRLAANEQFGDYQSSVAMSLAKRLKSKPRDVALRLVEALGADPAAQLCVNRSRSPAPASSTSGSSEAGWLGC